MATYPESVGALSSPLPAVRVAPSERDRLLARFEHLVVTYGAALERLGWGYVADEDALDDLLQDIMLALWRALPAFRGECTERSFVYRIAHNRGISHRARVRRVAGRFTDLPELTDPGPTPEQHLEAEQERGRLLAAMRQLPATLFQALALHLEGLADREVAEVLGIRENAVAVRLTRARAALRSELARPVVIP